MNNHCVNVCSFIIHSSVYGHLGCSESQVVNIAAMNRDEQASL